MLQEYDAKCRVEANLLSSLGDNQNFYYSLIAPSNTKVAGPSRKTSVKLFPS